MKNLCIVFVLALTCSEALCSTLRQKRQATNNSLGGGNGLDISQFPLLSRRPQQVQQSTTTTAPPSITTSSTFDACVKSCSVTSEYNPVCGSNNITYDNPGRLSCAQACGASVTVLRTSRCPNSFIQD